MLVYKADPVLAKSAGRERQRNCASSDCECGSGIWFIESRQNLDERGFARTVLTQQAMHFLPADGEIDMVQCPYAAEMLRQVAQLDDGRRRSVRARAP